MDSALDTPVFNEASVRSVNFFNGRLLSAEDLNKEKLANVEGRKQLGQAIGDGIAYGLEVTLNTGATVASVSVQPGLAINRRGRTLRLNDSITLALQPPAATITPASTTGFDDCLPPQSDIYIVNEGIYLLTLAPTEASEGRAQVSGLGNGAAACNVRYKIEAVQFRLISLTDFFVSDLGEPAKLRNRVAHRCFGTNDIRLNNMITDPFGASATSYGLIDDLRARPNNKLTLCEVPLAVLHWTRTGIQFVDMWSVRRRIVQPSANTTWPLLLSDRRLSEAEASFLQFQQQIGEIRNQEQGLTDIIANNRFAYLPPVGMIPLHVPSSPQGVNYRTFLSGVTYRNPVFIEGAQVSALVRAGMNYPALAVDSGVMLWLYLVRENMRMIDDSLINPPQAYMIFASGHVPFFGDPHYDVNRWRYSNFA